MRKGKLGVNEWEHVGSRGSQSQQWSVLLGYMTIKKLLVKEIDF